jgi:hypothetical protein
MFSRAVLACLLIIAVAGCEFTQVVFFSGDRATSYKREGATVTVQAFDDESCGSQRPTALAPALAAAAVGVLLNLAESAIDTYLANKKKQFTATYSAVAASDSNSGAFIKQAEFAPFDCVHIRRTVKENNSDQTAFEAYFALISDAGGTSQRLVPRSITLARAAALTDSSTKKVDVSVEVKIDVVSVGGKGATRITIVDQVMDFPTLTTPGAGADGAPNPPTTVYDCDAAIAGSPCQHFNGSGWVPAIPKSSTTEINRCKNDPKCKGVTPFYVAVSVTETGSGADAFGTLAADIDGNKNSVNSAITSYIQTLLTPTTSGGGK